MNLNSVSIHHRGIVSKPASFKLTLKNFLPRETSELIRGVYDSRIKGLQRQEEHGRS